MNKYFSTFVFCLFFCTTFYSQTTPPTDDVQFWNETTVSLPVIRTINTAGDETEKLIFFIHENVRVGRNVSRPVDERIGLGTDNFSGDFFCLLQNNRGSTLKRIEAFGVNLKVHID